MSDSDQTTPEPDESGDEQSPDQVQDTGTDDALSQAEAIVDAAAATDDAAAQHLEDLQRLQAEYVNYRRRVERDREAVNTRATATVIEALIPVLDDITAARDHGDLEDGPFAAIATKLEDALARFGWESYGTPGEAFDPQQHEALMSQPSTEVTEPTVQHVAQPGHRIGTRVVRPARVIVSQPE